MSSKVLGFDFDPDKHLFLEVYHKELDQCFSLLDMQGVFAFVWAEGCVLQIPASDLELTSHVEIPAAVSCTVERLRNSNPTTVPDLRAV